MADLDTKYKRQSAIGLLSPVILALPDPDGSIESRDRALLSHAYALVAQGIIESLNQATETEFANAIALVPYRRLVAQAIEINTARAIGRHSYIRLESGGKIILEDASGAILGEATHQIKTKAIVEATETELAQDITPGAAPKYINVEQANETETAQFIGIEKAILQVTENDESQAVVANRRYTVAQTTETELSQSLTAGKKLLAVAQSTEDELAQPISPEGQKIIAVDSASEADAAQFIGIKKAIIQVTESDLPQPIEPRRAYALAQITETDSAQSINPTGHKYIEVAASTESDLAQVINWNPKERLLAQATEQETAQIISATRQQIVAVGQVSETEFAQAINKAKKIAVALIAEVETAHEIKWAPKIKQVIQATETDTADMIKYAFAGVGYQIDLTAEAVDSIDLEVMTVGEVQI